MKYQIDEKTMASIKAVVQYLYEDEQKHWEESGRPDGHIFQDVKQLKKFVQDYYLQGND